MTGQVEACLRLRVKCQRVDLAKLLMIVQQMHPHNILQYLGCLEQDRQCTYNVTLGRVRANIFAMEK
jgi:hypothetical protein